MFILGYLLALSKSIEDIDFFYQYTHTIHFIHQNIHILWCII